MRFNTVPRVRRFYCQFTVHSFWLYLTVVSGNGSVSITPAVSTTFLASGTFDSGSTLSGTLGIDTLTGVILSTNLAISGPDGLVFDTARSQRVVNIALVYTFGESAVPGQTLQLDFQNQTSLVGFSGNTFVTGLVTTSTGLFDQLGQGQVVAVPEPASFSLMAFAILPMLRRRSR